jgi:peptidoglycan/xylan/chitin deacetylase (PgdA/CDA1 family)
MSTTLFVATGAVAAAGIVAHGAYYRNSFVFGGAIARLDRDRRIVALTFDDGPNPAATPLILDALREERVKATFFFLGRHVERWPDIARRAHEEGHEIANHGYAHRKLHVRSPAYVRGDIAGGADAIEHATGARPRFFRAPHGFRNPWVAPIARRLGERVVGWTLGVWDTDRPGADTIASRTIAGVRPGGIVLLHDGDGYDPAGDRLQTAAAVPSIIRALRARGYDFVGVGDA